LNDLKPFVPLVKGRIALLGDAGHATTPNLGQGAAQALESARILASVLKEGNEVEAALLQYESARKKRIQFIVSRSYNLGRVAHMKGPLKWMILALIRWSPESLQDKERDRIYSI
jgi:2-polyprenyl-6-methoxyphenol hydroxylase-like FAD-dependent oxidoreductase